MATRNPAIHQSHSLQGFSTIPGGCFEFLPSTVSPGHHMLFLHLLCCPLVVSSQEFQKQSGNRKELRDGTPLPRSRSKDVGIIQMNQVSDPGTVFSF